MKCWALWWLILSLISHHTVKTSEDSEESHSYSPGCCTKIESFNCIKMPASLEQNDYDHASCCLETFINVLKNVDQKDTVRAFEILQEILEETEVNNTKTIRKDNIMALLYKPTDYKGVKISATDNEVMTGNVPNSAVSVHLPSELDAGPTNTIVFSVMQLPKKIALERSDELSDRRIIGLSVRGKRFSGLQEPVNLTINITTGRNEVLTPLCVFLNITEKRFSTDGCETQRQSQSHVTCSCNHLTYFGVLMVSADLSAKDQEVLSYITYIGCGISLTALIFAVLLFITDRKLRGDDSKKIHISLAVSFILLNIHFLPSQAVAAMSSTELCLYVALLLHYSLLASFTWMALEGFHLYLLLVKVFNIYVRRYLLKLSVVGWGLPAVIVSVVVISNKNMYGRTPLDSSRPDSTAVCYITNDKVKMGTTLGLFSMVFIFNIFVFGGIAKWLMGGNFSKQMAASKKNKAKREIFTLLALMVLLGLTWGLIFFSFGHLTTPGLYLFCLLNCLQGFFICIYFVLSIKKTKVASFKPSSATHSTRF